MLHASVIWSGLVFSFIMNANQADPYATLLAVAIALLALVFLLVAIALFLKWQLALPLPVRLVRPARDRLRRGKNVVPILFLVVPALVLCGSASFARFSPAGLIAAPTVAPQPTKPRTIPTTVQLDLVNPGFLTIGTDPVFPPETYNDPKTGKIVGFDIDLISALAKLLKLSPKIVSSDNLLQGLSNGQFDVVISAYSLNQDVTSSVQSIAYLAPKDDILALETSPLHVTNLSDLCGHNVGVQSGSQEETTLQSTKCGQSSLYNSANVSPNADLLADALLSKKVDAIYQSSPTVGYYQKKYNGQFQILGTPQQQTYQEGILVRNDQQGTLFNAVKVAYLSLVENGTYHNLLKTKNWDLTADAINPTPGTILPTVVKFS